MLKQLDLKSETMANDGLRTMISLEFDDDSGHFAQRKNDCLIELLVFFMMVESICKMRKS